MFRLFTTPGRVFGAAINPNPKKKQMEMDAYSQLKCLENEKDSGYGKCYFNCYLDSQNGKHSKNDIKANEEALAYHEILIK